MKTAASHRADSDPHFRPPLGDLHLPYVRRLFSQATLRDILVVTKIWTSLFLTIKCECSKCSLYVWVYYMKEFNCDGLTALAFKQIRDVLPDKTVSKQNSTLDNQTWACMTNLSLYVRLHEMSQQGEFSHEQ